MIRGSGNSGRVNPDTPAAAAPTVVSAQNGLSLVGTDVELGGANPLLHNTTISMAGFLFSLVNGAVPQLIVNPGTGGYSLGDSNNIVGGTALVLDDVLQLAMINANGSPYLRLDFPNGFYQLGDISGLNNDTKIDVKDASSAIELDAGIGPGASLILAGAAGAESLIVNFAGSPYLLLTPATYLLGDIGAGAGNETVLSIQDSVQQVSFSSATDTMLFLDYFNGIYQLGSTGGANGTYFQVDDAARTFTANSGGFVDGILLDIGNRNFYFGDAGSLFNLTSLNINDSTQQGRILAVNGFGINIFPTLSPFAVGSLQSFANNAAATAGGLGVGDFYRLSVAGTSAVMVVE